MANSITDCCIALDPCDAVCLLNNVLVDLVGGNFVTSYRVGEESYNISKPDIADVERLLARFENLCVASGGAAPVRRRRARVQFISGNHRPPMNNTDCGC